MHFAIAFSQPVLESGILPDLESPHDIAIEEAPVSQAPFQHEEDDAAWGFVKRGRRFRASLSLSNLTWAVAIYAPGFGLDAVRSQQFIHLLTDVANVLGDEATPDELYVAMRDLLVGTSEEAERPIDTITAAYRDLWDHQGQGSHIFDSEV